jgi:hypothetical protein
VLFVPVSFDPVKETDTKTLELVAEGVIVTDNPVIKVGEVAVDVNVSFLTDCKTCKTFPNPLTVAPAFAVTVTPDGKLKVSPKSPIVTVSELPLPGDTLLVINSLMLRPPLKLFATLAIHPICQTKRNSL